MKTLATVLTISASLLAATGAHAASNLERGAFNPPFDGVYGQPQTGKTRAQVQAELAQAKAQGLITAESRGEGNVPFDGVYGRPQTGKTRAQVQAELAQYKAEHPNEIVEP